MKGLLLQFISPILKAIFVIIGALFSAYMALSTMMDSKIATAKDDLREESHIHMRHIDARFNKLDADVTEIKRLVREIPGNR